MYYLKYTQNIVSGNVETIKKFQNWLREWEISNQRKKHEFRNSQNGTSDSSSSDFTSSSEDESEEKLAPRIPNTALLLGPCGVGKTVRLNLKIIH